MNEIKAKVRPGDIPHAKTYEGPYHITPTEEAQTLATANQLMAADVTIDAVQPGIPFTDIKSVVSAGGTSITFTGLRNEPSAFSVLYHGSWEMFVGKVACLIWQGGTEAADKAIFRTNSNTNFVRTGGFEWTYSNGTLTITLTGTATNSAFNGTYVLAYDSVY